MQIRKFAIDNHRCLVDFEINLETKDGGCSTILIGENGTGKITMMESLLEIMMSFDSDAVEKTIDYNPARLDGHPGAYGWQEYPAVFQ